MHEFLKSRDEQTFLHTGSAESYGREEGTFQVEADDLKKKFATLVSAFLYFMQLEQNAEIWDVSLGHRVLVEQKRLLESNPN